MSGIIAVSAVVAMASVLLVFQMGQPRIWMSMSRDGLLPQSFAKIHPKYKTPSFSTIVTGLLVAIPIFFVDITMVTDICSAGTLFAFCLVCGGVLKLRMDPNAPPSKFKTPYVNARWIIPALFAAMLIYIFSDKSVLATFTSFDTREDVYHQIPLYFFFLGFAILSVLAFKHRFSLIPSLGLLCCFYMLSQLGYKNWLYFSAWLLIGLIIYFVYGYRHSKLAKNK